MQSQTNDQIEDGGQSVPGGWSDLGEAPMLCFGRCLVKTLAFFPAGNYLIYVFEILKYGFAVIGRLNEFCNCTLNKLLTVTSIFSRLRSIVVELFIRTA